MLFLGAGASKEFDIPLFNEIAEKFLVYMKGEHRERMERIKKELDQVGFQSDIENYISYARGQLKPRETLLAMNPFVSYFVYRARRRRLGGDLSAKNFVDELEEYIYDSFLVRELDKKTRILSHYDRFLKFLKDKYCQRAAFEADIFTTNYDDVIEFYSEERVLDLFDGFNETADGMSYFAPELYGVHQIRLYKLHGSVRLGIVKEDDSNNTAVIHSKKRIGIGELYKEKWRVIERMMLLGYDKEISREPCFELLRLMKEKLMLTKTCIAIGYSFGNLPILGIFKDVLNHRGEDFELVILSESADEIKSSKFPDDRRVRALKNSFSEFGKI